MHFQHQLGRLRARTKIPTIPFHPDDKQGLTDPEWNICSGNLRIPTHTDAVGDDSPGEQRTHNGKLRLLQLLLWIFPVSKSNYSLLMKNSQMMKMMMQQTLSGIPQQL